MLVSIFLVGNPKLFCERWQMIADWSIKVQTMSPKRIVIGVNLEEFDDDRPLKCLNDFRWKVKTPVDVIEGTENIREKMLLQRNDEFVIFHEMNFVMHPRSIE